MAVASIAVMTSEQLREMPRMWRAIYHERGGGDVKRLLDWLSVVSFALTVVLVVGWLRSWHVIDWVGIPLPLDWAVFPVSASGQSAIWAVHPASADAAPGD